jgi:hypothetical protein
MRVDPGRAYPVKAGQDSGLSQRRRKRNRGAESLLFIRDIAEKSKLVSKEAQARYARAAGWPTA